MSAIAESLPGFDLLPRVSRPVMGIDPSSKRIAVAVLEPQAGRWNGIQCGCATINPGLDSALFWRTLPLPPRDRRHEWFAVALERQVEFFEEFPYGPMVPHQQRVKPWSDEPPLIFIEEPFVPRDRREVPTHLLMYGVTLAALGQVWPYATVHEIGTNVWKSRALGQGHGHCKPAEYVRWAESVGYTGRIEDECAAIGVAVGGAILKGV